MKFPKKGYLVLGIRKKAPASKSNVIEYGSFHCFLHFGNAIPGNGRQINGQDFCALLPLSKIQPFSSQA